jgi:hypothetical protein
MKRKRKSGFKLSWIPFHSIQATADRPTLSQAGEKMGEIEQIGVG